MTKTPEQMAEEWYRIWHKEQDFIGPSLGTERAFVAGYQAAKDEYKVAIDTYNDVAKQMLEEAVRIMSPKDQLADADKVMCNTTMEEIKAVDTGEIIPITNLPTPAKWISVKERLPEIPDTRFISEDVLWLTRYGEMEVSFLERLHSEFMVDWGDAGLLKLDQFTHWMPLPAAPKEEA